MCERCEKQEARDRVFWQSLRRALLMVASAIEKRYADEKQQNQRAA